MRSSVDMLFTASGILLVAACATFAPSACAQGTSLAIFPEAIELRGKFARQQVAVDLTGQDVTASATYAVEPAEFAQVSGDGYLTPLADGAASLVVSAGGFSTRVPLKVSHMRGERSVDFGSEVMPLLSRYGCNSGGCHGKASGQNGFKLSLFGFDVEHDYDALVKQDRGRRVFPAAPERSLLLTKAAGIVPHGGGRRFEPQSESWNLLVAWMQGGLPRSSPEAPQLTGLLLHPPERVFAPGESQQLVVLAEYSDGSRRDVTRSANFDSNQDVVASADGRGVVATGGNRGEAAIMARYMGQVAVFRAIVPHGPSLAAIPGFQPANYIDELAAKKWGRLGLLPSPVCDDATFLRRVTLDLCGRLPSVDEVKAFLADNSPNKRAALIDRLLDSPDYASYFAMRWGAILRNSRLAGADQAAYAFHNWIKEHLARNRPYDEFVRGIVAAAGEWQDAPAINWYWQSRDDQLHQVTADTAQVFLGLRLQCARCHHHPYERYSQEDYYGLAGFFTRLGRKSFGQPPPYFAASQTTVGEQNPLTGRTPEPKYLDGEYAKFTPEDDPRHALVDWMADPANPYFAKALVNRLWGHLLGRGLVHEVDDLRETNPPSNPELLDALARDFIEHKFDMKHMLRTIANSRVYQLSSEPTPANEHDHQNFARFYGRRLIAEALLDAVDQATGVKTRFGGMPVNARAVELPHEGFGSYFLDAFDRPKRVTSCECERSSGATLAQVLLLANSDEIENRLASGEGRAARLAQAIKDGSPPAAAIEEVYLAALSRPPSPEELAAVSPFFEEPADPQRVVEDVLWTVINSKEFLFQH